jgi:gliding motility-associated-like protein
MAEKTNAAFSNCRVASNMVSITVNPLPDTQVKDSTKGCEGTNVSLAATGGTSYAWTGPNGFSSTQQSPPLPNLQPGEAGIYKVVVTDDKGCSKPDSTRLVVFPAVAAAVNNNSAVCEGTGVPLQASGGVRYLWAPTSGLSSADIANPVATPSDTTLYTVTVFSDKGCYDTASVKVNIWKKPVANAGPDQKTREGVPVTLTGSAQGTNISYYWTPASYLDNVSVLHPTANPPEDTWYTLNVVSNMGCGINSDKVFVRVYKDVKVPNAFSPNGDGTNDTWKIEALVTYPEADIQVFNRFGQVVFESHGYSKPWDGTYNGQPLPAGTYYYVIDLKTDVFPVLNGWVLIVR